MSGSGGFRNVAVECRSLGAYVIGLGILVLFRSGMVRVFRYSLHVSLRSPAVGSSM